MWMWWYWYWWMWMWMSSPHSTGDAYAVGCASSIASIFQATLHPCPRSAWEGNSVFAARRCFHWQGSHWSAGMHVQGRPTSWRRNLPGWQGSCRKRCQTHVKIRSTLSLELHFKQVFLEPAYSRSKFSAWNIENPMWKSRKRSRYKGSPGSSVRFSKLRSSY